MVAIKTKSYLKIFKGDDMRLRDPLLMIMVTIQQQIVQLWLYSLDSFRFVALNVFTLSRSISESVFHLRFQGINLTKVDILKM